MDDNVIYLKNFGAGTRYYFLTSAGLISGVFSKTERIENAIFVTLLNSKLYPNILEFSKVGVDIDTVNLQLSQVIALLELNLE